MQYKAKNKVKTYYIGLNKANNGIVIALTKAEIARFLGISVYIVTKYMRNSSVYDNNMYTIWRNISVKKVKRGYAL